MQSCHVSPSVLDQLVSVIMRDSQQILHYDTYYSDLHNFIFILSDFRIYPVKNTVSKPITGKPVKTKSQTCFITFRSFCNSFKLILQ